MRIGELSRRTGVSERSLRYYEERGMLYSQRSPRGHREYPEAAVDRVVHIQELFAAGLHSAKIQSLLPCMRDVDGGPAPTATPRLVAELEGERERLNRAIAELESSRDVLDDVIAAADDRPHSARGQSAAG